MAVSPNAAFKIKVALPIVIIREEKRPKVSLIALGKGNGAGPRKKTYRFVAKILKSPAKSQWKKGSDKEIRINSLCLNRLDGRVFHHGDRRERY